MILHLREGTTKDRAVEVAESLKGFLLERDGKQVIVAGSSLKEVPAAVEEKVAEVKEVVAAAVAPSGEKAYATCVGCHGAKGEGGVGPRLNNQTVADVIAKLEKYKSGEQVGPMTGMMAPMAAGLSADDMKVIAEYVTTL